MGFSKHYSSHLKGLEIKSTYIVVVVVVFVVAVAFVVGILDFPFKNKNKKWKINENCTNNANSGDFSKIWKYHSLQSTNICKLFWKKKKKNPSNFFLFKIEIECKIWIKCRHHFLNPISFPQLISFYYCLKNVISFSFFFFTNLLRISTTLLLWLLWWITRTVLLLLPRHFRLKKNSCVLKCKITFLKILHLESKCCSMKESTFSLTIRASCLCRKHNLSSFPN